MRLLPLILPVLISAVASDQSAVRRICGSKEQPPSDKLSSGDCTSSATATAAPPEDERPEDVLINVEDMEPIRMIYIEPASFIFGISYAEDRSLKWLCYEFMRQSTDMGPKHRVTVTKGFYLAQTETRVDYYCAFLNDVEDASQYIGIWEACPIEEVEGVYVPKPGTEACPVNSVPWIGAQAFCDWLSRKTGRRFRLPTEAEWELAAYGPEKRTYAWGDNDVPSITEEIVRYYGRYAGSEPWSCSPVGSRPKNVTPQGLLDMTDVTGEWVSDWYARQYDVKEKVDPQGPASGERKVLRGQGTGLERRESFTPSYSRSPWLGFRILMEPDEQAHGQNESPGPASQRVLKEEADS